MYEKKMILDMQYNFNPENKVCWANSCLVDLNPF